MLSSLTRALRRKKIREGSSSEESYASPATTASSGISTPSPPPGHRFRRNRGSSTDDDNDDDNDDDILNEDYRVGGPQLAPLPCQPVNLTQGPVYNIWLDEKFPTAILRIAEKHKVDIKAIVLQGRVASNPNFRSAGVLPTVVISAKRHNLTDHSWASACREILQLFAQKGLHDLNVEIIDDRALIQNFPTAVPATDPIFPLWDKVMDMIHSHISRDGWQSLECLRWGPNEDGLSNPTTVILTVPYDTERNWKATREIIVHVLQYFKLPGVAVAILRGQVWRGMGFGTVTLPDNAWDQKVQVGMSIGPSGDKMSGSTIGAVLELESPHSGKWVSFGITCFHCVVARSINSDEEKRAHNQWSENGVMPDDELATKYLNMDQPALRDHLDRMGKINEEIREIDEDQEIIQYRHDLINDSFIIPKEASCKRKIDRRAGYMAFMANAEKFFTQGHAHLGHVYAASGGFRLTEEKPRIQLDWALITINSQRLGPNKLPPAGTYESNKFLFEGGPIHNPPKTNHPIDEPVFKLGRTTNATEGRFTGLKALVLKTGVDRDGEPASATTLERAIIHWKDPTKPFSEGGDSGSAVVNSEGQFLGLLFAGNDATFTTYFTPWEQLFEDIKKFTGAKNVRLPS